VIVSARLTIIDMADLELTVMPDFPGKSLYSFRTFRSCAVKRLFAMFGLESWPQSLIVAEDSVLFRKIEEYHMH
jgi:hypothetical protein